MLQPLPRVTALKILVDCAAGLQHLHSLGVLHRNLCSGSVVLSGAHPSFSAALTDAMTVHRLVGAINGILNPGSLAASVPWLAPEVLVGLLSGAVTATPASDVYMFGGLMFEVLTGGCQPFYWLPVETLLARRTTPVGTKVAVPGVGKLQGLQGVSAIDAAARDGVDVRWSIDASSLPDSADRLALLKELMAQCLNGDVHKRPRGSDLLKRLTSLLLREEGRDVGSTGAGTASMSALGFEHFDSEHYMSISLHRDARAADAHSRLDSRELRALAAVTEDSFRLIRPLGSGGFATVYEVTCTVSNLPNPDKHFALKGKGDALTNAVFY